MSPAPSTASPTYSTRRSAAEPARRANAATAPRNTASAAQPNAANVAHGWSRAIRPTRSPVMASAVSSAPSAGTAARRKRAAPWASFPTGRNLGIPSDATRESLANDQGSLRISERGPPKKPASPALGNRAGLVVSLSEGRGVTGLLLLAPLLGVPARSLARRVVDETADRRLVDEVGRPLEERDHRHVVRHLLSDLLDQRETLRLVELTVGLPEPPRDGPVAVLRVVGCVPAREVRHVVMRVDRHELREHR